MFAPIGVDKNGGEASSVPGGAAALGGVAHRGTTESIVHGHTEVVPPTVVAVQVSPYTPFQHSCSVFPFSPLPNYDRSVYPLYFRSRKAPVSQIVLLKHGILRFLITVDCVSTAPVVLNTWHLRYHGCGDTSLGQLRIVFDLLRVGIRSNEANCCTDWDSKKYRCHRKGYHPGRV